MVMECIPKSILPKFKINPPKEPGGFQNVGISLMEKCETTVHFQFSTRTHHLCVVPYAYSYSQSDCSVVSSCTLDGQYVSLSRQTRFENSAATRRSENCIRYLIHMVFHNGLPRRKNKTRV